MLQFYSTANITMQMPERFPQTQCETKDNKHWSRKPSVQDTD